MMTKGKYWCGDLCYVINDRWDEVCSLLFPPNKEGNHRENEGELELKDGTKFAIYGTAWGDGSYEDNLGNEYGVDAGVIGCIKVDDLLKIGESPSTLGTIHEFDKDFETGYDDGTIFFGDVRIETDSRFEEEEVNDFCYCTEQGGARCKCDENDDS